MWAPWLCSCRGTWAASTPTGRHEELGSPTSRAAQGTVSFPEGCGGRISCGRTPLLPVMEGEVSCFLRNVQFLWQNTSSDSHAVLGKWRVFKCGEARWVEGGLTGLCTGPSLSSLAPGDGAQAEGALLPQQEVRLCTEEVFSKGCSGTPCGQRAWTGGGCPHRGSLCPRTRWSFPARKPAAPELQRAYEPVGLHLARQLSAPVLFTL